MEQTDITYLSVKLPSVVYNMSLFCYDTDVTEQGAEENIWTKEELRDFII
jgi:hypothetical protein